MENDFKPFDRVVVREAKRWPWRAAFYSHYNPITYHHYTTSGAPINEILPYEGNEHLIGTTNEPVIPFSEREKQDAYWARCTEQEKANLRNSYKIGLKYDEKGRHVLEKVCGKHNLQEDSFDEEDILKEGEWIMAKTINGNWVLATYEARSIVGCNGYLMTVNEIVRFVDFDPYNMEETEKHILYIKDGKIQNKTGNN